jgi:hypothetical protein
MPACFPAPSSEPACMPIRMPAFFFFFFFF